VTVGARHPPDAESAGQGILGGEGGDRGGGGAVAVQRHRVQGAPLTVAFAADLVQDQVVHVQLGVAVAAGVLAVRGDHPFAGVLPPAARVVAGAGLPGLALQVVEGGGVAFHDRVPDAVGDRFPGLDVGEVAALGCGGVVGEGAGVE
jgi:hypothetical protein